MKMTITHSAARTASNGRPSISPIPVLGNAVGVACGPLATSVSMAANVAVLARSAALTWDDGVALGKATTGVFVAGGRVAVALGVNPS